MKTPTDDVYVTPEGLFAALSNVVEAVESALYEPSVGVCCCPPKGHGHGGYWNSRIHVPECQNLREAVDTANGSFFK